MIHRSYAQASSNSRCIPHWSKNNSSLALFQLIPKVFIGGARLRDGAKAAGWITRIRQRDSRRFVSFGIGLIAIGTGKMAVLLMTSIVLCGIGALLLALGFRFSARADLKASTG